MNNETPMSGPAEVELTPQQTRQFHEDGFIGPFTLCPPEEILAIREQIQQLLDPASRVGKVPSMIAALRPEMRGGFGRHHDQRFLFDLASHPEIVGKVASVIGSDVLLWRTMFFNKPAGAPAIPWHQDFDDWKLEPMLVISCWLALDATSATNGCVELIPGSHKGIYALVPSTGRVMNGFPRMADPGAFSTDRIVSMHLQPGQFFLFNERVLHRSLENRSTDPRLGLAMRYIPPLVRMLDPNDCGIVVSGQDHLRFNPLVAPPS